MIICLVGASGVGKTTIQNELCNVAEYQRIVSYTTREPRAREIDGTDYHFINNTAFMHMIDEFAEFEEYSAGRLYGTLKSQYNIVSDAVVVLTPHGVRQLKKNVSDADFFIVYIDAPLKDRVLRYIKRCDDNLSYSDITELTERIQRDFGMFRGFEDEADLIVNNPYGTCISSIVGEIWKNSLK